MKKSNNKGFTLVELVVVIAIIGVLAAILVPSMMGYVKKSRLKTANGNAKTAYNAIAVVVTDKETAGTPLTFPSAFETIDGKNGSGASDSDVADAVKDALADNGNEAGQVAFGAATINGQATFFCQWRKTSSDDIFGQYPQAIKKVSQCTGWGTWKNV
ncbi:MAG: type II secretion system protein [Ruminococcus sp.]|nr:type II secretion system protein [Ruminococcus sp.]